MPHFLFPLPSFHRSVDCTRRARHRNAVKGCRPFRPWGARSFSTRRECGEGCFFLPDKPPTFRCFLVYLRKRSAPPLSAPTLHNKYRYTRTIFSKIAAGEIPSYKCAENEDFYAFLDINPVAKGHTLVIPRREVDYVFDLDDETLAAYHRFAKRVALAIGEVLPCRKVGMAAIGLEVPHAHLHLIPLNDEGDMDFRKPKLQLPAEEMQATADAIRAAFERQNQA